MQITKNDIIYDTLDIASLLIVFSNSYLMILSDLLSYVYINIILKYISNIYVYKNSSNYSFTTFFNLKFAMAYY